jgi:hypothetical protein
VRGLDRNELRIMLDKGHREEPYADYLIPAAKRLLKRGVMTAYLCEVGHCHLERGPMFNMALKCHRMATERVVV